MLITPSGNHAQNIKLRLNLHLKKKRLILSPPTSNKNLKFPKVKS